MIVTMGRRSLYCLWLFLTLTLVFASGCLHHQLELTTRRALNTLPDLHYQQVMDNLAAIAANPAPFRISPWWARGRCRLLITARRR